MKRTVNYSYNELNKLTLQSFEQAKEETERIFLCKENGINLIPPETSFSKQFLVTLT
jgi:hypothetical protein